MATTKKAKGRQPTEWVGLFMKGAFFGEVGVFASNKTASRSVTLTENPKASDNPSSAPSVHAGGAGKKAAKEETPAEDPTKMYVRVKEGKSVDQTFPLTDEQLQGFRDFEAKFKEARGVHIRKFVPGAAVAGCAHKNVFFLAPRSGVAESEKAYRCLHESLQANHLAAVAHRIHGKGFDPVAIMAVDEGLVMWQLPSHGTVHDIKDVVPTTWQKADVTPQERTMFSALVEKHSLRTVTKADTQDPITASLEKLAEGTIEAGTVPSSGTAKDYPTLITALEALVRATKV